MSAVFKKLNLKDHTEIVVAAAPASFEPELKALRGVAVRRELRGKPVPFALVFVTQQNEVDGAAAAIGELAVGDAIVWFAYPKKTSKKYRSEIDRDTGWRAVGATGFEPVRMVAIDDDWSAVRFRRVEHIKTLTRGAEHAVSAAAKAKIRRERGPAGPRKQRKAVRS